jgi:carbamoyl-phosphate synthase large subunit
VLAKYNVEMIGARAESIDKAENRECCLTTPWWRSACPRLGTAWPTIWNRRLLRSTKSVSLHHSPIFTMGGSGGGVAYNKEEFVEICTARYGAVANQRAAD